MIDAEEYLRRVDLWIRDLPWKVRQQLVAELRGHLSELPAVTDLRSLGTPEQYAADLRAGAGLGRRRGPIAFLRARRPRNLILTVVVLTVIGLAIGAVAWVQSYQPLGLGDSAQFPAATKAAPGQNGSAVVFHEGRPFEFGVTIQNNGRFTVRVLGVLYEAVHPFATARLLMSRPQKEPGMDKPWKPFRPFDMKPGETRWLVFSGVYACNSGASAHTALTLAAFPVRFKFLWRTTTVLIPLDNSRLEVEYPKGCLTPSERAATG